MQLSAVIDEAGGCSGFLAAKLLSVAASYQCCIVPPFQEYFFCIFMAMVSCRYKVFDPILLPSTSMSVAYTLPDHKKREVLD